MIEWTDADQIRACEDGWYITDLRRRIANTVAGVRRFASAQAAHAYVAQRADEGSELHVKALAYVVQQRLLT